MGTQDYNSELGIIKCIERLSRDTEACMSRIGKVMDHNFLARFRLTAVL